MLIAVVILSAWKIKSIINRNSLAKHFFNATLIALFLTPLTWVNPSAMRAVQYYSLFLMFLVPEVFQAFKPSEKNLVYYAGIGLLVLLLVRNNPQYLFFWQ